MRWLCLLSSFLLAVPVFAQPATVAVYAVSATDPNTAKPVSTAVYSTPDCPKPIISDQPNSVNPNEGAYDDPANPGSECRVDVRAQYASLAPGTYKAAVKLGTLPFGPFSSAFAMAAAQTTHPCDATPASPQTMTVSRSLTMGFCHTGTDATNTAPVTSWRVYRNGVLQTGTTVVAGTTTNAQGLRLYTVQRTEAATGAVSYEVSGVNVVGEGPRMAAVSINVQASATVPAVPVRGRITVP